MSSPSPASNMETTLSGDASSVRRSGMIVRIGKFIPKEVYSWQGVKILAMGQGLAGLICGTAISSQYLATSFHVNTPMLQSLLNYTLLCITYTTMLVFRTGDGNILQIMKQRWWKYLLLALVDVEANYTVVKAYQYTTLTSVQLLDCFVIPVVMILSWWVLKTRYRLVHYVAVCICLLGVGAMVGADLLTGRDQGSTSNILLGDSLVLISATLYAVSNVGQEYTVKNLSRVEFLGMVGLFGTLISTIQMVVLERDEVAAIQWSWQVGLLFSAYGLCMYALYSFMPILVKKSSAASVNLSLLTADLFSLFSGIFLFHYNFSGLYMVSLVAILIGFITFNAASTPTVHADSSFFPFSQESSSNCPLPSQHDCVAAGVTVSITAEETGEGEEQRQGEKQEKMKREEKWRSLQNLEEKNRNENAVAGHSTKM